MKLLRRRGARLAGPANINDFAPVHTGDADVFSKGGGVHHLTVAKVNANMADRVVIKDQVAGLGLGRGYRWQRI